MQIWIYLNDIQQGPYSLEQLRAMGIDPATPVWYEGLAQWMPAAEAPVTAALFAAAPQETHRQFSPDVRSTGEAKPPSFLAWNIVLTVLCCNIFSIIGIITGVMVSSRYNSGDVEGARKMSHIAEWMVILGIVGAIVSLPLAFAYNLM